MIKRIKLFSTPAPTQRIKLFGDIAKCGASPEPVSTEKKHREHVTGRILVCHDCGFQEADPGTGSTKEYCPVCGSSRFEYLETMPGYGRPGSLGPTEDQVTETEREFSRIQRKNRISLFSSLTRIQPNTTGEGTDNKMCPESEFECRDCGHHFALKSDTTSGERCPRCGGNRVVRVSQEYTYSDSTDMTVEFLRKASGRAFPEREADRLFSECGATGSLQDLIDSGYATRTEDGQVCFTDGVDSEYSLFSKLVITVTKELDLDPVTPGTREDLIHSLEGGTIPAKGILLIKKAHGLIPHSTDTGRMEEAEEYLKDSGISHDLGLEHGGETMRLQDFLGMIKERYNDAPENLLDLLTEKGIVTISGSNVAVK